MTARVAVLVLLVSAAALVGRPGADRPELVAAAATGPVAISGTPANVAIIAVSAMRPGGSASGRVTITNTGSVAADVALALSDLTDVAGRWGGRLSTALELEVADVTGTARRLYRGAPAGLRRLDLGTWSRNETHVYAITLRFPNGGRPASPQLGDNLLQGAGLRFDLVWGADKHNGQR